MAIANLRGALEIDRSHRQRAERLERERTAERRRRRALAARERAAAERERIGWAALGVSQ